MSNRRRLFWFLLAACAAMALLILALMPAERTLGQVIKIVYLHGALSRAGMLGFAAAGICAGRLSDPTSPGVPSLGRSAFHQRVGLLDRAFPGEHARHAPHLGPVDRLG